MARSSHGIKMMGKKTTAEEHSVATGDANSGDIYNVSATDNAKVKIIAKSREMSLPLFLSDMIVFISEQSLSAYAEGDKREFPPEILDKLRYNNIDADHVLIRDFSKYSLMLDNAYRGVEQRNSDARYLVRRKAGFVYCNELGKACAILDIPVGEKKTYARRNSEMLIEKVIRRLLEDYATSKGDLYEGEIAHLAVSLIVADAIAECEVLEKVSDAASA